MKPAWLVFWEFDQEHPTFEYNPDDETISFSTFPDHPQSFAIIEGFLFDKHNFRVSPSASDAERVIDYYQIFGEDLFVKLRGAFSLVIWDAAKRCLIAGRDHMGQIPFYYFKDTEKFFISSSTQSLLEQPSVSKEVNRVVIAEHLLNYYPNHQLQETFFKHISRLPPAHYLIANGNNLSKVRYWNPLPPETEWVSKVEENSLMEVFRQAVERCLDAGADSISLSGGLDSISIAVMAAKLQKEKGGTPPHAISGKFPGTGADDGPIQRDIAQSLGMSQTLLTLEEILPATSIIQASLDRSAFRPLPGQGLMESTYYEQMRIASKGNLNKIMQGIGGDEMFFVGYSWQHDLFDKGKFLQLLKLQQILHLYLAPNNLRTDQKLLLKNALRFFYSAIRAKIKKLLLGSTLNISPITFPVWIIQSDNALRQEIEDRRRKTQETWVPKTGSSYINSLRKFLQDPCDMHFMEDRYFNARQVGYNHIYPYFDPDLIQLAYRVRPERKVEGNLIKAPLQQFLIENNIRAPLPPLKTDFMPLIHHLLRTEGKQAWHILDRGRKLSAVGIIDQSSLNNYLTEYFTSTNQDWDLAWKALSTETWLNIYS